MRFLTSKVLLCTLVTVIALTATCVSRAQESSLPWCGLEQLNLDLGPREEFPSSRGHWLVIAIQNRGDRDCKLPPLSVGFPPDGPDFTDIMENTSEKDTSASAVGFKEKSRRLAPGGEAHVMLAWSSVPVEYHGIVIGDCKMHDTMTVYADPRHPALEVRHLWIQSCDQIWRSSYRAGPYVSGEPVSDEWLQRVQLNDSDFANSPVAESARVDTDAPGGTKLWALLNVQYLRGSFGSGYYGAFPLFLKTSSQASENCPFDSLRKREADGPTTIYLSHCEDHAEPVGNDSGSKQIGFSETDFGLAPEKPGRVEYEAISRIQQGGNPTLEKAKLELFIRDPNRPMLPIIDTRIRSCGVSQLKLNSPEIKLGSHWGQATIYPPLGQDWYDGKVFEVTNTSNESCMIGGLPELKFQRPSWWTSGGVEPPVCRNCATPLFKPRESRWIELKPGESAHFMVARALSAYWPACTATGRVDMRLPGDTQTLKLPFEANFCGEIPVSAWRSGKYDGDPMNIEYDRNENERVKKWQATASLGSSKVACVDNTKPRSELPSPGNECAEQEFAKRGRPSMSAANDGIAFGFSSPQQGSTKIYVWMDNKTNEARTYFFCCVSTFLDAIDVYDSTGHRLLSGQEQASRKGCAEGQTLLSVCTCSTIVTVARHTMQMVDWGDLQDSYVLPPGRFFVAASHIQRQTCESLSKPGQESAQGIPTNALMIIVPE